MLRRHHRALNFALFEDRILDRNTGQMVNPNMEWYLLAGMSDIPEIDVVLVDQPERGVIGIGEPPTVLDRRGDRQRGPQRDRRDDAQPAAAGRSRRTSVITRGARNRSERAGVRGRCEGLCLRQPDERERGGRRARAGREKALPLAGGMDLLALMKDYITQPDRIVNVKNRARRSTVTPRNGGLRSARR